MNQLKIERMVLGVVGTNCYYIYRQGESDAICIDPADQGGEIYHKLQQLGLEVKGILLTHGHFDHLSGANELAQLSGAPMYALEAEKVVCESADVNLSSQMGRTVSVVCDHYCQDGATITVGNLSCKIISTPGHTIGSCCYYFEQDQVLISGDTLFLESVGRTDLPTGSMKSLVRSIRQRLFILPEEVTVYPGHGDSTAIGHEKLYNTFC
ncbi:MAG: MBL fold metallo-hydrolase [Eubacteriales bacterium]